MTMELICEGLCRAQGTGQCAPVCLQHFSVRTSGGQCPERTRIWRRQATEIAYSLGSQSWIDPTVEVKQTGITVQLSVSERMGRAVRNPNTGELISALLLVQAQAPLTMFSITESQYLMMKAKADRLLGKA